MSTEPVRTSGADVTASALALLLYGDEHTNLALAVELTLDGYQLHRASDPAMLRAACNKREIALVIFGRAADRGAGLDVLRRLRAGDFTPDVNPQLRALWMSPNGELGDVLGGFQAGADDVIRGPFAYPEFRARVQALILRRDLTATSGVIEYAELRIDTAAHEVTVGASPVGLRRLEYALLVHLASDPARVYTKAELLRGSVGHRLGDYDEDPGLARLAAAMQARPRRRRGLGARHPRRRLPPRPGLSDLHPAIGVARLRHPRHSFVSRAHNAIGAL